MGSILELWGFKEMKWKNTSQFFCPGRKCCPWERFGSVACSLACSVACIVAWVLRVVCSVVCGGCHVAYFASCSAVTMRTTTDGWSPGSSWWREEICKTKNTRIPFLPSVLKFYVPGWRTAKKQRAEAEGCFGHLHWPVRSFMFELNVMEPGAFKFDYIATQAGQSSAGMPENGCRTRRREEAESFSKKLMKVTSTAWQPHATRHYTLHATLHATLRATLPNCWQGQQFGALRLQRNEMKIQVDFSVLTGNAAPWQRFGSVACGVACRVACSVAWMLRVVCSVACGGCHVAYFASCSAVCRWRVRHTGGTMRTTNDGWSPGSSWWQEEICKTKTTRVPFLSSVLKFYVPGWRTAKKQWAEAEGCFGHMH